MLTILTLVYILMARCSVRAYAPPCINGTTDQPSGCDPNRIKKCSEVNTTEAHTIEKDINNNCAESPRVNDAVDGKIENDYVVQFDGENGECLAIRMQAGECWGVHPITTANYDCQGRCGPGCGSNKVCNRWGPDCLKHDVCSWYYGATGGAKNVNCGDEFHDAVNDYMALCWYVMRRYILHRHCIMF